MKPINAVGILALLSLEGNIYLYTEMKDLQRDARWSSYSIQERYTELGQRIDRLADDIEDVEDEVDSLQPRSTVRRLTPEQQAEREKQLQKMIENIKNIK